MRTQHAERELRLEECRVRRHTQRVVQHVTLGTLYLILCWAPGRGGQAHRGRATQGADQRDGIGIEEDW